MPLGPVKRDSRNLMRRAENANYLGTFADHYYNTGGRSTVADERNYPGGQNGMIYRGGYSHDAGSFNIIHGGN